MARNETRAPARDERRILLAEPHGFCAGVKRAVAIVDAALHRFGAPLYCINEIVHNRQVVEGFERRGVVFVRRVEEAPQGSTVLFSAHGVSPAVRRAAEARGLRVVDATCPFVVKVHAEVRRYAAAGYTIFLVGKRNHDEIVGVAGEAPESVTVVQDAREAGHADVRDAARVAVVTQTTLSVEETEAVFHVLRLRFPNLATPPKRDICYATTNRQNAVKTLAARSDLVLVLGSENSSNTRRLVEVATACGGRAVLIPDLDVLKREPLERVCTLGLTAGASTPDATVDAAVRELRRQGFERLETVRVAEEKTVFPLPAALRDE